MEFCDGVEASESDLVLGEIDTGWFQWTVLARSEEEARRLLLDAYQRHVESAIQGVYDPDRMAHYFDHDHVEFTSITVGAVLRDGSPI